MEAQLIALIESYNKLIDTNANLTLSVNQSLKQSSKATHKHNELLKHCGELYELLEAKNNKTRVEEICINKLRNLITHNVSKE